MAHESFENEEIARILNRSFVSIKVDREERPDIDAVYMTVCQAMTGSGGWPLTILMTPKQNPFYAGTYLPRHSRYGYLGLSELLLRVEKLWQEQRENQFLVKKSQNPIRRRTFFGTGPTGSRRTFSYFRFQMGRFWTGTQISDSSQSDFFTVLCTKGTKRKSHADRDKNVGMHGQGRYL